jgi:hypothetical protein
MSIVGVGNQDFVGTHAIGVRTRHVSFFHD